MNDNSILKQYYKGLVEQINSEVQLINNVFHHNGLKGEGNENMLRDLLKKFIPKKYGIGSGLIIDKNGNQSRQCDIVIYDNYNYPELLSMSSVKLYPVDIVYAVVEIKTKLDSAKSKIAIENINSVLTLDYIKEKFRVNPTEPVTEVNLNTVLFETKSTTPPIGMIFSYESLTTKIDTFMNWFNPTRYPDIQKFPTHICCLDQGMIVINPNKENDIRPFIFPLITGDLYHTVDTNVLVTLNGKDWCINIGDLYPFTEIDKMRIILDQSKLLLNFILILTNLLRKKFISPRLDLRSQYLTNDLHTMFTIEEGKMKKMK